MTEVRANAAERTLANLPKGTVAALLYGPDQGLVRERAEALIRSIVPDLKDPFRIAELDDDTLWADPARLADEAAAISMLGGRRVVRVRGAGNRLAPLFERFLDDPGGDALVVVEAGDLAKTAALPKVFLGAGNALAVPCYGDTQRDLPEVIRDTLRAEGLSIAGDALEDTAARLGSDRGVTRRELEKLALYAHGQKQVTLADVHAVLGDDSELRTDAVCDAAGEGDTARLDRELQRLGEAGTSPATILRAALGHFQRLLGVKLAVQRRESIDAAMRKGWPQIHFSRSDSFKRQVARWEEAGLVEAGNLLLEAEALTRTTAVPAEAVTGRALFTVAAMARRTAVVNRGRG